MKITTKKNDISNQVESTAAGMQAEKGDDLIDIARDSSGTTDVLTIALKTWNAKTNGGNKAMLWRFHKPLGDSKFAFIVCSLHSDETNALNRRDRKGVLAFCRSRAANSFRRHFKRSSIKFRGESRHSP